MFLRSWLCFWEHFFFLYAVPLIKLFPGVVESCAFYQNVLDWVLVSSILDELVRFIKNYIKSEPTLSAQKFVSEWGKIYTSFKQKHWVMPDQNLLGPSRNWKVSADLLRYHNDYPKIISSKCLRPNIVLSRTNIKIIEGVSPWCND